MKESTPTVKVQANVSRDTVKTVNCILEAIGQTPTSVINSLYHSIANTGKVPFEMGLNEEQLNALKIRQLAEKQPVTIIHNDKEFNKIWEDDDAD